jgi:hypothetical protein
MQLNDSINDQYNSNGLINTMQGITGLNSSGVEAVNVKLKD